MKGTGWTWLKDNTIISFTNQRVGKDLKKDGGTHRGRHTVRVACLLGLTIRPSSLDWTKAMMVTRT